MTRACLSFEIMFLVFGAAAIADPVTTFRVVIDPADTSLAQLLGINHVGGKAGDYGGGAVMGDYGFTPDLPGSLADENVGRMNAAGESEIPADAGDAVRGFTDFSGNFMNNDDPSTVALTELLGAHDSGAGIREPAFVSAPRPAMNSSEWGAGYNTSGMTMSDGWLDTIGTFLNLDVIGSWFTGSLATGNPDLH